MTTATDMTATPMDMITPMTTDTGTAITTITATIAMITDTTTATITVMTAMATDTTPTPIPTPDTTDIDRFHDSHTFLAALFEAPLFSAEWLKKASCRLAFFTKFT